MRPASAALRGWAGRGRGTVRTRPLSLNGRLVNVKAKQKKRPDGDNPAVTSWPKRKQVDPADLIGAGEILKLVGWKTRKSLLDAQKTRDFPPPVVVVRGARLWHREDVERWISLGHRD
jgi:hypothetical protein